MQATGRTTFLAAGMAAFAVAATATFAMALPDSGEGGESGIPHATQVAAPPVEVGAAAVGPRKRVKAPRNLARWFKLPVRQKVFFITVDDGFTKSAGALAFVKKHRIPVTVFVTGSAIGNRAEYFRQFAAAGGSVENHTLSHPVLPQTSDEQLTREVCGPQSWYKREFGRVPSMIRPPFGEGGYSSPSSSARRRIDEAGTSCGLRHLVMWNALAEKGEFEFLSGSLKRGDIVLFHFTPWLEQELKQVMRMASRKGLRPAALVDYLP